MEKKEFIELCKNKVSKRNFVNSMTTSGAAFERLWRPHNYRREIKIFPYEKKVKTTILKKKGFIVGTTIPYKMSSHTGIVDVSFSDNISIQVKRETVLGIWQQNIICGEKETVLLFGNSKKEVLDKRDSFKKHILSLVESAVSFIIEKLGLHPIGSFYKDREENWFRSKHSIDKLPRGCVVHEDHWKKVYQYGGEIVEKKTDPAGEDYFRQFINNELVLDFAPEIAKEIVANRVLIKDFVDKVLPIQQAFAENMKSHTKVVQEMAVGFEKFNVLLSKQDSKELSVIDWCKANLKSYKDTLLHGAYFASLEPDELLEVSEFLFKKFGGVGYFGEE